MRMIDCSRFLFSECSNQRSTTALGTQLHSLASLARTTKQCVQVAVVNLNCPIVAHISLARVHFVTSPRRGMSRGTDYPISESPGSRLKGVNEPLTQPVFIPFHSLSNLQRGVFLPPWTTVMKPSRLLLCQESSQSADQRTMSWRPYHSPML
jgi:hypothetical protein